MKYNSDVTDKPQGGARIMDFPCFAVNNPLTGLSFVLGLITTFCLAVWLISRLIVKIGEIEIAVPIWLDMWNEFHFVPKSKRQLLKKQLARDLQSYRLENAPLAFKWIGSLVRR